jgi:DNA polymerase sigma
MLYLNKYECLQPLYLVIRLLLHNMGLDDPANGGLSSFGIILLIVCMIQSMTIRGQDISIKSPNLGML